LSNKILQLQKEEEEKQTIKAFILFVKLLLLSKNTLTNPNLIYQTFLQLKKNVFREKRFCIRRQDVFVHNAFLMNQFFLSSSSSSSSSSSCTQTSFLLHFTEKDFALCLQLLLHSATPNKKKHKKLVVKKASKNTFSCYKNQIHFRLV